MHARNSLVAAVFAAALLTGCSIFRDLASSKPPEPPVSVAMAQAPDEPAHVVVQHVLIAFEGSGVPGTTRTKDEAQRLALRVLEEARRGHDFDDLVRLYSDDNGGKGTYAMANWGVPTTGDEVDRREMVRGFGALAFSLGVGEIGMVEYDANSSPFGWHILKRVR